MLPAEARARTSMPLTRSDEPRYLLIEKLVRVLRAAKVHGVMVVMDRVDEPTLINGDANRMRAVIWPMLNNKFLQQGAIGFKLLLPLELRYELLRESSAFFQEARLDKQSLVERLTWTGTMLYDLCAESLNACRSETGRHDKPARPLRRGRDAAGPHRRAGPDAPAPRRVQADLPLRPRALRRGPEDESAWQDPAPRARPRAEGAVRPGSGVLSGAPSRLISGARADVPSRTTRTRETFLPGWPLTRTGFVPMRPVFDTDTNQERTVMRAPIFAASAVLPPPARRTGSSRTGTRSSARRTPTLAVPGRIGRRDRGALPAHRGARRRAFEEQRRECQRRPFIARNVTPTRTRTSR